MTLFLIPGEPGVGKSSQCVALCKMLPNATYLSMEIKDKILLERAGINNVQIIQFDNSYNEDPVTTLHILETTIKNIIYNNEFRNVVLDGISDIRKFATKEWIYKDNVMRARDNKPPRTSITGENKAAWAAINNRVTGILEPLVNWSNINRTNVFFTAQMADAYLNDTKVGRRIAVGDWIEFDVDVRCFLICKDFVYIAKFTKLPDWAVTCDPEVLIGKEGLIALFAERNLLQ